MTQQGAKWALLESLPKDCKKLATTLEYQDVYIMRNKGIDASYRFDFLNDEMWRVKDRLAQEYIDQKRLVVFTNPPFVNSLCQNKSCAS